MKKALIALTSLAMVAGLASCRKPANGTPVTGNVTLTFGFEDTKVTYTEVGTNLRPAWEIGDIIVGQTKDGSTNFALTVESVSGGSATVTGDAPLDADVCLLYKKGLNTIGSLPITVDYSNQSGDKNMPAVMLSKGHIDKDGKGNFTFSGAGAVIGIDNAKGVPAGSAITKVTISGDNLSEGSLTKSGDGFVLAATPKTDDVISTGTLSGITVTENDSRLSSPIFIAVPVGAKVAKVTLTTGRGDYYYKLPSAKDAGANNYFYVKDQTFTNLPEGALPGEFSVSATKKVHFSQGNLTYNVLSKTWSFYEHQYDCASGYDANLISLFNWGYNATKSIIPDDRSSDNVSRTSGDLAQSEDWGCTIGDGNTWRTLTTAEWRYLFNYEGYTSDIRNGKYRCGVNVCDKWVCVVIAPDDWDISVNPLQGSYDSSTWPAAEAAGLVCLPATVGYRDGSTVYYVGGYGNYWSSTAVNSNRAYSVIFDSNYVYFDEQDYRIYGNSVRLITEPK